MRTKYDFLDIFMVQKVRIEIIGLRLPIVKEGDDIVRMIVDTANEQAGGVRDRDIIVITSKIVSKAMGYVVKLSDVKPSKYAVRLGKKLGMDPRFIQAVIDNSDEILFVIPFLHFVRSGIIDIEKISQDKRRAIEAARRIPYVFVVRRGKQIYTDAGLDYSNNPNGFLSTLHRDVDAIARRIRKRIKELTGKNVAIVISDTEAWFPYGSLDFARGSSGIQVISREFGNPDMYGRPKFGGADIIVHEIASAAALVMGQTSRGIPVAIIRGLDYNEAEEGVSDVHLSPQYLKEAIRRILVTSIRILGLGWLLRKMLKR